MFIILLSAICSLLVGCDDKDAPGTDPNNQPTTEQEEEVTMPEYVIRFECDNYQLKYIERDIYEIEIPSDETVVKLTTDYTGRILAYNTDVYSNNKQIDSENPLDEFIVGYEVDGPIFSGLGKYYSVKKKYADVEYSEGLMTFVIHANNSNENRQIIVSMIDSYGAPNYGATIKFIQNKN